MKNVLFLSLLLITHLLYGCGSNTKGQEISEVNITKYTYEGLSQYQRSLLNGFIESMFPPEFDVNEILTGKVSIRSTTRLASALLFRNETADRENAIVTGPYIRSYGMDMNKYYSITGIVLSVALNDEDLSPLPKGKAPKYLEISNIAPMLHLGLQVPDNAFQQLSEISSDRFLDRVITNQYFAGDSLKRVTASIKPDWMMGGLWGNRRVWNQTYTGTIHWKNADGEIGWLLVPGDGKTNVQVSNTQMGIYNGEAGNLKFRDNNFSVYVFSDELTEKDFSGDVWTLGNMKLHIATGLERTYTKITDSSILREECAISENYPAVMKITFQVPRIWGGKIPLLEIDPEYLNN